MRLDLCFVFGDFALLFSPLAELIYGPTGNSCGQKMRAEAENRGWKEEEGFSLCLVAYKIQSQEVGGKFAASFGKSERCKKTFCRIRPESLGKGN